jgi:hypothetical protein
MMDYLALLWSSMDGWLARRSWAPTAEGLAWLALSIIILVQGLARGFNLVTFIAAFLLSMWLINLVVTIFSGYRLRMMRGKRRLLGMVHVGTPVTASIELENLGNSSINGVRITDTGSSHEQQFGINTLPAREMRELKYQVVPLKRGPYRWEKLRVSTGYPFGLARRSLLCPMEERDTLVLPLMGQLDLQQFQRWLKYSERVTNMMTRVRARRSSSPADFYGIRSYRSGDSPRWIHWRTTARVGYPMVREFEEPPQDHITVLVEAWLPKSEAELQRTWRYEHARNIKGLHNEIRRYGDVTPQEYAVALDDIRLKEAEYAQPLDLVEQCISLASTLCYVWTRKLGSNISMGVVDGSSRGSNIFESGPTMRQLMPLMDRLALTEASTQPKVADLQQHLEGHNLPPGAILLIAPYPSQLAMTLAKTLNRPVQLLDMSQLRTVQKFFTTQAKAVLS